jgi:hypothetical protein
MVLHRTLVKQEQRNEAPLDFSESCLEYFKGWQQTTPATQPGITHTSFATFQGQPSQPTQASPQSIQSTQLYDQPGYQQSGHQSSYQQSAGRGRDRGQGRGSGQWNSTKSTCRFCTGPHQSGNCYYFDPRQKFAGWQENPHFRKQYDDLLASNPTLRQETEEIKHKPIPTNQN